MFKEKAEIEEGKIISLGVLLEFHKITWPFVALLFNYFSTCEQTSRMALMSGFFGGYGLLWVLKSHTFYDIHIYFNPKYHYNTKEAVINYLTISIYYIFPWKASTNCTEISYIDNLFASFCFIVGGFLHYSSDSQKFYTLKYRPKKLITEGLFEIIQHPNYTGEFLIWVGFIIVSDKYSIVSYFPILFLFIATVCVGIPNKDKSLKKYDEYGEWNKKTKLLIPGIY
tara:strand:- start:829 stop:1506 length:678 start_codon:yes stop_codon:yes gene_type:complete